MIFRILAFIGVYFLIKKLLRAFFALPVGSDSQTQRDTSFSKNYKSGEDNIVDAEFKVIKEE